MKYPRKWEEISGGKYSGYVRLKIYGGWLVSFWTQNSGCEHVLHIEDFEHEWTLEEEGGKE